MLEPAAALRDQVQEHVFFVRQRAPHLAILAYDFLGIGRRALAVPNSCLALIHEEMRDAIDFEPVHGRVPGEDRRIDQRVVIGREIVVRLAIRRVRQAGHGGLPLLRQFEPDLVRTRQAIYECHESRSAVEQCERIFHPVRPDRHFAAINAVRKSDLRRAAQSPLASGSCAISRRRRGLPAESDTVMASTFLAYSRTRYDPGVQTGMKTSTSGWPPVGSMASTET